MARMSHGTTILLGNVSTRTDKVGAVRGTVRATLVSLLVFQAPGGVVSGRVESFRDGAVMSHEGRCSDHYDQSYR